MKRSNQNSLSNQFIDSTTRLSLITFCTNEIKKTETIQESRTHIDGHPSLS